MHSKWSLLLVSIVWSCTSATGPQFGVAAELNQTFQLRVGESARFEDAGLELRFVDVDQDSRCPSNALILCVWEGDASVVVEMTSVEVGARTDTLHTNLAPKEVNIGSFLLRLERLDPYPVDVTPIPVGEYIASFVLIPRS